MNSFENRVYMIETEDDVRVVSTFYRPQRWTREQILEEHQFLADLVEAEVPVCPTLRFPDRETLKEKNGILYCLFEARGGCIPEELSDDNVERMGMLVARMHNVGDSRPANHRIHIKSDTYIWDSVAWLEEHDTLPPQVATRYLDAASHIAGVCDEYRKGVATQRIHSDCHLGNLLLRDNVFTVEATDHCYWAIVAKYQTGHSCTHAGLLGQG